MHISGGHGGTAPTNVKYTLHANVGEESYLLPGYNMYMKPRVHTGVLPYGCNLIKGKY